MNLIDTQFVNDMKDFNNSVMTVNFNKYFGAWQLQQKRKLYEDFNFTHRLDMFHELVRMQIKEGACLSFLGLVSINESGVVEMTELTSVLAGGIREAREFLKREINSTRANAHVCAALGILSLLASATVAYFTYEKNQQLKSLRESIEKSKMEIHKMPTVKAEEMGTQCLICYVAPSNIVLIPCNHLCICSECFLKLKENSNSSVKCPMCRLEVDLKHQIMIIYDHQSQLEKQTTRRLPAAEPARANADTQNTN